MLYALIGLLVLFIPVRCTGCVLEDKIAVKSENSPYYFVYENNIHEMDKTTGKEIGIIPGGTILYEVKRDSQGKSCYIMKNGAPVLTYVIPGDSSGYPKPFKIGQKRRFFLFWKTTPITWKKYSDSNEDLVKYHPKADPWISWYQTGSNKAKADALALFEQEFKKIKILEHTRDDFDNNFFSNLKDHYILENSDGSLYGDKGKICYISFSDALKMKKLQRDMTQLYQKKFAEYCMPLSPKKSFISEYLEAPIQIKPVKGYKFD